MTKIYDVDYFIRKFSAIPEEKWFVGDYCNHDPFDIKCCARGHCGKMAFQYSSKEDEALLRLFDYNMQNPQCIANINDGKFKNYPQHTPRARVLAALYDLKREQCPEISDPPVTAEQVMEELEGVKTVAV